MNTHGSQVLDTWAFNAANPTEYMSMDHTRSVNSRWAVAVGLTFVSTRRRPMLTLIEDTTPGAHDTLLCACNAEIYHELGVAGHHADQQPDAQADRRALRGVLIAAFA